MSKGPLPIQKRLLKMAKAESKKYSLSHARPIARSIANTPGNDVPGLRKKSKRGKRS